MSSSAPLACRRNVFSQRDRVRHAGLIEQLTPLMEEVQELPAGYALRFTEDGSVFARLAEWMRLESACCPFLDFELQVVGRSGPVELRLTGRDGVKDFLKSQFAIVIEKTAPRSE
jgi:hypothetical protein